MLHRDDYIKMLEKRASEQAKTEKEYMDRAAHWGRVGGTAGALAGLGAGAYHGLRHGGGGSSVALGAAGGALLGNLAGRVTHGLSHKDEFDKFDKVASDFDGGKTGPTYDHDVNSGQVANSEHRKNLGDNRQTLDGMFSNMGEATRVETRFAKKWFPSEKYDKDTSSPLIKVAMSVLSQSERFRSYPAHYKAAAVRAFIGELGVIKTGD